MMASLRWPKARPGAAKKPSPSGPRWASAVVARRIKSGSKLRCPRVSNRPAMPHTGAPPSVESWRPYDNGGASASIDSRIDYGARPLMARFCSSRIGILTRRTRATRSARFTSPSTCCKTHEVSLGFAMTPGDARTGLELGQETSAIIYCGRISTADRLFAGRRVRSLTGEPLSVAAFRHGGLDALGEAACGDEEAGFHLSCSRRRWRSTCRGTLPRTRVILDFVDVDSEKWRQYARDAVVARALVLPDGGRAPADVRPGAGGAGAGVASSFRRTRSASSTGFRPRRNRKHVAIANGVDVGFFDPATVRPRTNESRKTIVFVGMMDYWPNIDAVTWFAKEILPLVRRRHAAMRGFRSWARGRRRR